MYNAFITDSVGSPVMVGIYKPIAEVKKRGFGYDYTWTGEYNKSSIVTGLSNKTRVVTANGFVTDRYTVSIKGNSKCTYRLVAYDNYITHGGMGKSSKSYISGE